MISAYFGIVITLSYMICNHYASEM